MTIILKVRYGLLADFDLHQPTEKFEFISGDGRAGTQIQLNSGLTIGRSGSDLLIAPAMTCVSRMHCQINSPLLGEWNIQDLGSKFGTFLKIEDNLMKLQPNEEVALQKGSIIILGDPRNDRRVELEVE
ncbi:MAG: FHA domain-containing protein [Nanoarchaeota archaeon]